MLRRPLVVLVRVLVAGLVLAGCTTDGGGPASPTSDAGTSAASDRGSAAERPRVDYVALGDSYTAGPLISTVRSDPSGCARSTNNYPAFLAEWLQVRSYRDVSCSGAATRDVTSAQPLVYAGTTTPPQRSALSAGTDLVTVGLGGNDFDLFARLSRCARGLPSTTPESCDPDRRMLLADAARVEDRLVRALRVVSRRSPEARVVVVGYPRVLPVSGTCPELGLTVAEADTARAVERRLETSLRAAARRAGDLWVGLRGLTRGHDACAGDAAWVTGVDFEPGQPAPLHPRIEGMRAAAEVVYRALTGQPPPASAGPTAAPDPDAVVRNPVPR